MKKNNFKTSHAASLHLYNIYILKITLTEVGNRLVVSRGWGWWEEGEEEWCNKGT